MLRKILGFGVLTLYMGSVAVLSANVAESNQAELVTLSGYTPEGHKKWDLLAKSAEIFPGGDDVNLDTPKGTLFEEGDPEMYLDAEKGTYNPKTGNVVLEDNVRMKDVSGAKVKTSHLYWNSEDAVLQMKNNIEMTKDNAVITGRNLKIIKADHTAVLNEKVKLKAFSSQNGAEHPSVITCTGQMEVNYQENFVEFHDDVVISDPKVNLKADYMKVYFDRKSKVLDRVFCEGNVLIVQDTKRAMSGQAEYDALEGFVLLSGSPRVLRDGNVLTADNIMFYLQSERVICKPSAQLVLHLSNEDRDFFEI